MPRLPRICLPSRAPIRALLAALSIASLFAVPGLRAAEAPPVSGHWEGEIELPGGAGKLQVMVELKQGISPSGWVGTIDIPAQAAKGVPLEDISVDGAKVRFSILGAPGHATFDGTLDGGKLAGTFSQGQLSMPFHLGREKVVQEEKAQDPKPPFPYKIEEVAYTNGDVKLAGTLTTPAGAGPFPAVLLITGSGSQDRNETIFGHKPFWVIADHLSRHGIAVLRVDDRGVGGSTGDPRSSTSADFAQDVLSGVSFLKGHAGVDAKRIGLLGHSEGGLIAPLAASQSPDVAFIILLAGTGVPGEQIVLRQLEMISRAEGTPEDKIHEQVARQKRVFEILRTMKGEEARAELKKQVEMGLQDATPEQRRAMGGASALVERQIQEADSPWFRFFATFDPRPALRQVKVPVLALNGEKDLQVPADQNLPEIEKALKAGGNRDVTVQKLPGLNHLFQPAATGSPAEYALSPMTIDPKVLDLITDWIRQRFVQLPPAPPAG
jgi:pimeloyl-ACP methyl ester carboxylesterase